MQSSRYSLSLHSWKSSSISAASPESKTLESSSLDYAWYYWQPLVAYPIYWELELTEESKELANRIFYSEIQSIYFYTFKIFSTS